MPAKNVRDTIIGLIILAVAVWALLHFVESHLRASIGQQQPTDLLAIFVQARELFNFFLISIGILVLILIPVWIAKRREERKAKQK